MQLLRGFVFVHSIYTKQKHTKIKAETWKRKHEKDKMKLFNVFALWKLNDKKVQTRKREMAQLPYNNRFL